MNKKSRATFSEMLGGMAFVAAVSFCDYLAIAFSAYRFRYPDVTYVQLLRHIADVIQWR